MIKNGAFSAGRVDAFQREQAGLCHLQNSSACQLLFHYNLSWILIFTPRASFLNNSPSSIYGCLTRLWILQCKNVFQALYALHLIHLLLSPPVIWPQAEAGRLCMTGSRLLLKEASLHIMQTAHRWRSTSLLPTVSWWFALFTFFNA